MSLTKPSYDWRPLPLPKGERLSLRLTLASGQSFRWQEITTDHWCCVLDRRIYVLRQMNASSAPIDYCIVPGSTADFIEEDEAVRVLTRHLRLDVAFTQRLQQWSKADAHFAACLKNSAAVTDGVRVLRLAPVEALISFICSSNNHIARISSMVQRLCRELGPCVGEVDGQPMYDLPPLTALAQSDAEERMRAWGFGYRARFLCETARCITQQRPGGEKWFEQLAQMPYAEAHQELLKLPGVGPKVADCIVSGYIEYVA
jgi:N-glycosylase/DNA lyase